MPIPFTQYLLPDGRKKDISIECSAEVEQKAQEIIAAGYRFECEVLRTSDVSLTIHNPTEGDDVDIELVANGPEVPAAVERLVTRFQLPAAPVLDR